MGNLRGGYQIINLKNVSLTSTAVDIDSTIRGKILNSNKAVLLTGLVISNVSFTPLFTTFNNVSGTLYSDVIYVSGVGSRRVIIGSTGKIGIANVTDLPTVSASDNGKVLMVKNGSWSVESLPE